MRLRIPTAKPKVSRLNRKCDLSSFTQSTTCSYCIGEISVPYKTKRNRKVNYSAWTMSIKEWIRFGLVSEKKQTKKHFAAAHPYGLLILRSYMLQYIVLAILDLPKLNKPPLGHLQEFCSAYSWGRGTPFNSYSPPMLQAAQYLRCKSGATESWELLWKRSFSSAFPI